MTTSLYLSRQRVQLCVFNYFVPTDADMNTRPHMVLTDSEIEWDPHGSEMATNRPYGDNAILVKAMTAGEKR